MKTKTKELLLITVPVALLTAVAGLIYWFLIYRKYGQCKGLLLEEITLTDWGWCLLGMACALAILFAFIKLVPLKYMYDPNVRILADSYSMRFHTINFLPNAFYEELLFRGTVQVLLGILPATLIFTLVHVSYYKKPVMLLEAFCQGLVLAFLFQITSSIWITTTAHATFNTLQIWLIKKDIVKYRV